MATPAWMVPAALVLGMALALIVMGLLAINEDPFSCPPQRDQSRRLRRAIALLGCLALAAASFQAGIAFNKGIDPHQPRLYLERF